MATNPREVTHMLTSILSITDWFVQLFGTASASQATKEGYGTWI
jgi:hypothetical protein